jgi:hypothetical protein
MPRHQVSKCPRSRHINIRWHDSIGKLLQYSDSLNRYLHILYKVLDAAHKYDVLVGNSPQEHSNHLDRHIGEADLVDLADPSNMEYDSCLIQDVRGLQRDSYRTLRKALGFLFKLAPESVQKDVREKNVVEFTVGRQGWSGVQVHGDPSSASPLADEDGNASQDSFSRM